MIACFDVYYTETSANAAAVVFNHWQDKTIKDIFTIQVADIGDYDPGNFYLRELKPLRAVLETITYPISIFILDAYCHLSSHGSPGLGAYLHQSLPEGSIVVGVAKNRFRNTTHAVELIRGGSKRPLFVTSVGVEYQRAAAYVRSMPGEHRIPTMLRTVDRVSRTGR